MKTTLLGKVVVLVALIGCGTAPQSLTTSPVGNAETVETAPKVESAQAENSISQESSQYLLPVPVDRPPEWKEVITAGAEWNTREARFLNDALWFLEAVYRESGDPHGGLIRFVPIKPKTGDEEGLFARAPAYYLSSSRCIFVDRSELEERGSSFFALVFVLNHEYDHALNKDAAADEIQMCEIEMRTHKVELTGIDASIRFIESHNWGKDAPLEQWEKLIEHHRSVALANRQKYVLKLGAYQLLKNAGSLGSPKSDQAADLAVSLAYVRLAGQAERYYEIQSGKPLNKAFLESMEKEVREASKALPADLRKEVDRVVNLDEWAESIKGVREDVGKVLARQEELMRELKSSK